jgi:hypothetical protein
MNVKSSRSDRDGVKAKAAAARAAQVRAERRRRWLLGGIVGLVVVALVGAVSAVIVSSRAKQPSLAAVQTFPETAGHTTAKVTYPQTPPAGGPHNQQWLTCGIYATPVPNENAVHDLEHGAVWVTYRPNLSTAQVEHLRTLVRGKDHLTLSPYPGLPAAVVASAWGKQLRLSGDADPRLPAFIAAYRNGAQAPERGGECTGGVGTPIQ